MQDIQEIARRQGAQLGSDCRFKGNLCKISRYDGRLFFFGGGAKEMVEFRIWRTMGLKSPGKPQVSFIPQNIAIDQGIHF